MATLHKKYTAEFKAKVAVDAIKKLKTTRELAVEYGIHVNQISLWRKQALAAIPGAFLDKRKNTQDTLSSDLDEIHRQIMQLLPERAVLKKPGMSMNAKTNN